MMKKNLFLVCFSFFLVVLIGCAPKIEVSPQPQSADISKRPDWTMNIPEEAEKLYSMSQMVTVLVAKSRRVT